jgi:glycosyltransferase involved in cell wall biosynthesis
MPDRSSLSVKKLCFISRSSLEEAPYADLALPALANNGWMVDVIAPGASRSILRLARPYHCRCFDLNTEADQSPIKKEMKLLSALWRARRAGYDVIYINSQSLSARAYFTLWGLRHGTKVVYHNPDFYDPAAHSVHYWIEKRFCKKVDLSINNEFHRGYITSTFYGTRCPTLIAPPNLPGDWPIAAKSSAKRLEMCGGKDIDAFVLMLHGSFSEIRMVPQLLEAMALLPPRFRLVMTSKDHRREEADALINRLGLEDRVVRLPRCDFSSMLEYTVNADAGVLFYQNNDLGNFFTAPGRLTEYLACGLPVIGTNHTGLENLILKYGLGTTVDTTNPRHIAQGLIELEAGVRQGGYQGNRDKFLRHFAFDHWEPALVAAFDALVKTGPRTGSSRPPFPWMPSP